LIESLVVGMVTVREYDVVAYLILANDYACFASVCLTNALADLESLGGQRSQAVGAGFENLSTHRIVELGEN
jgi:hypothetical protein